MNQFLTTKTIAREALPILESNLVFPALIYKDFSEDFSKQGDTIQVRKPPVYNAAEFDGEIEIQDINEGEVLVKLDKIADVSVELSAKEMALNAEDFTKQVIEPAMVAIAEKINADGLALYKDIPYVYGEAGTTPSTLTDLAGAAKILNDHKAPIVGRGAVWNTEAIANFQVLPALVNAEKCGSTDALREGAIGRVFGVDHYFSQQVPQCLTSGTPSLSPKQMYLLGKNENAPDPPFEFAYAYAITTHKAQGSEWAKVLVVEERFPFSAEDHKRWLYTACTRASEKLVVIKK